MKTKRYIRDMRCLALCGMLLQGHLLPAQDLPLTGEPDNHVQITEYTSPECGSFRRSVQYYDGLGRERQTSRLNAGGPGPGGVTMHLCERTDYDGNGSPFRTWLPFRSSSAAPDGTLPSETLYSDSRPYTEIEYDGSPLSRPRTSFGAGSQWYSSGKAVRSAYLSNGSSPELSCRRYSIQWDGDTTAVVQASGYYPAGVLTVNRTESEDGLSVLEFKDLYGRTILERRHPQSGPDFDTYYVYDGLGRLSAVFPPALSATLTGNATYTDSTHPSIGHYAYLYRYDDRGNCIAKKLPGCGWTYMVYDGRNSLVLSQDGELRRRGRWRMTLTDGQGRLCLGGTCCAAPDVFGVGFGDRSVHARWTGPEVSGNRYGYVVSTTGCGMTDWEVTLVNWWDGYDYLGNWGIPSSGDGRVTAPAASAAGVQGLLTGSLEKVLGPCSNNAYLWTVRYYDGKGREIRTVWKSHLGIGYETEDRDYAFSGEVTERRLTHVDATGQNMTERYTYSYDDWGRPLTVHHQLGGGPLVSLHTYSYDGLGRLSGDGRNGAAGLVTAYSYNVRSWLTESATGVSGGTFRERLSYSESQVDGTPNTPRWGGDVSRVSSCATGDASAHHYRLGYDGQGRLVSAAYGGGPSGSNYSAQFGYDSQGNVLTSSRSRIGGGSGAELGVTELTSFQYTGNQLTGWLAELQLEDIPVGPLEPGLEPEPGDSLIRPLGLVAEPSGELLEVVGEEVVEEEIVPVEDMQGVFYDRCGRVVGDPGSGIQSVEYNELSLPSRVTFTGVRASLGSDRYGLQYVASGRKLRTGALLDVVAEAEIEGTAVEPEVHGPRAVMQQVVPERAEVFVNERDYVGNLVYQGGVLDKILIDGGYIDASDGSYHFFVTDRLGNVRVVANAGGGAEQVNHYDPYGGTLSISSVPDTSGNLYKWGGKEWDKTLYRYDFGARLYSPSDLRWGTMDPLCEKYYSLSPYAYCANNPMNLVDPSGEDWYSFANGDKNDYLYTEGQLSDNEIAEKGYSYMGKTFSSEGKYYSLFGIQMDEGLAVTSLYKSIDLYLIKYAKYLKDSASFTANEFQSEPSVDFNINGLHPGREYYFSYLGRSFKSDSSNTFYRPINPNGVYFRGNLIKGDTNLILKYFPDASRTVGGTFSRASNINGYYLTLVPRGGQAFESLQIMFDRNNASAFVHSYNKLFGLKYSLR